MAQKKKKRKKHFRESETVIDAHKTDLYSCS